MIERDIFSAAWYCVRDSEKITFEELTDRLKALHGSGCTDAQRVLAKGLAMAVWDWLEAGGTDCRLNLHETRDTAGATN